MMDAPYPSTRAAIIAAYTPGAEPSLLKLRTLSIIRAAAHDASLDTAHIRALKRLASGAAMTARDRRLLDDAYRVLTPRLAAAGCLAPAYPD